MKHLFLSLTHKRKQSMGVIVVHLRPCRLWQFALAVCVSDCCSVAFVLPFCEAEEDDMGIWDTARRQGIHHPCLRCSCFLRSPTPAALLPEPGTKQRPRRGCFDGKKRLLLSRSGGGRHLRTVNSFIEVVDCPDKSRKAEEESCNFSLFLNSLYAPSPRYLFLRVADLLVSESV